MVLPIEQRDAALVDLNEPPHSHHDQFAELDAHNSARRRLARSSGDPSSVVKYRPTPLRPSKIGSGPGPMGIAPQRAAYRAVSTALIDEKQLEPIELTA